MASRPQVTITLGRSGQVVKKADVSHSDYLLSSGGKRPLRDRLGTNADNPLLYDGQSVNKRQRREDHKWSSGDHDLIADRQNKSNRLVGRDDLRLKLMQKNLSRRRNIDAEEQNGIDLRERLSRNAQIPLRFDARQHMPESKTSGLVRRIPPTRSADDLLRMDSLRKPYPSWSLDGLRHRSPDRLLGASRGVSPPRNIYEPRHVPSVRSVDASRPTTYPSRGAIGASRPSLFTNKVTVPVESAKPVVQHPPTSGVVQKSSYAVEEPLTVSSLLHSMGLGKYAILFQAEEVDMTALKQMGDNDLKELGIPMGPRKKILLAVLPRTKQRHP